jgi:2-haloacid dehalogenase
MIFQSTTVIFDVGNVLIQWDIRRLYRQFLPDDAEIDEFLREVDWFAWNLELDRGGRWDERVAELSARHPQHRALIEAAHHRWHDAVAGEIVGTVEILAALRAAETPLYAITNFSAEKWAEVQERFGFLAESFRDVVVSAHERLIKPDPAIYRVCLERNDLAAGDCIFIDDSPHNVAAADALGIDGILFTDPETLRSDLGERGFAL